MGGTLAPNSKDKFNLLFRGLLEKEFPAELANQLRLPEAVPPPGKPYIFVIPQGHSVFNYKFIREVRQPFPTNKK